MYREMSDDAIEHTLSLGGSPVLMHIAYRQLKASEAILAALGEIREMLAKPSEPQKMIAREGPDGRLNLEPYRPIEVVRPGTADF